MSARTILKKLKSENFHQNSKLKIPDFLLQKQLEFQLAKFQKTEKIKKVKILIFVQQFLNEKLQELDQFLTLIF